MKRGVREQRVERNIKKTKVMVSGSKSVLQSKGDPCA